MTKQKTREKIIEQKRIGECLYLIIGMLLIVLGLIEGNYFIMILGGMSFIYSELMEITRRLVK